MNNEFCSYPHSFIWYRNKIFKENFEYVEKFQELLRSVGSLQNPGMISQAQLEGLRLSQKEYDANADALEAELYYALEIADTPHMVRKIMIATNMPLKIIEESHKIKESPKEEIMGARKILTNQSLYISFQNNHYDFYHSPLKRNVKHRIRIQFAPFQEAMDEYILKIPKSGDYSKSRLFIAIKHIIEADQLPYFRKKFPQSFTNPQDDSKLIEHLTHVYDFRFPTHVQYIIKELRRLSKIDEDTP